MGQCDGSTEVPQGPGTEVPPGSETEARTQGSAQEPGRSRRLHRPKNRRAEPVKQGPGLRAHAAGLPWERRDELLGWYRASKATSGAGWAA
jgi:hypothetical protein